MASKVPPSLKAIAHYVKIANENAERDPVVYYWCLYYAVQTGMTVDRSTPEALKFLTGLLSTLEIVKKQLAANEAITNEVVAQAHLESFAFKLFTYASGRERAGDVDAKVVNSFYTAGHLLDTLTLFGELDDKIASMKKYAKWKATQIFSCLKSGTPYVPTQQEEDDELAALTAGIPQPPLGFGSGGGAGGGGGGMNSFGLPSVPPSHGYDEDLFAPGVPAAAAPPSHPSSGGGWPSYGGAAPTGGPPAPAPRTNFQPDNSPFSSVPQPPAHNSLPGYHSTGPTIVAPAAVAAPSSSSGSLSNYSPGSIPMEQLNECKKLCKWAMSALDYEDVPAAVDNLRKALAIVDRR